MCGWNRTLNDFREKAADNCEWVEEDSDSSGEVTEMVVEEPSEKWDCETILCEFLNCPRFIHFIIGIIHHHRQLSHSLELLG